MCGGHIAAQGHMTGMEKMPGKTIVATIVQKVDEGPGGQRYIVVRSSAIAVDTVITVSQQDFDHLYPGMLVTVSQIGWGVFSTWRLRR
jgi:hypothetical protein